MNKDSTGLFDLLGVKLSTLVAGFAGGIVSLAFLQGLSRPQAIGAVVVGTLSAAYLTPFAVDKLGIAPTLQNGAAFVIGLCAMSIIPAVQKGVTVWAGKIDEMRTKPKGESK